MRLQVKFAELHLVLFMGGNLGTKLTSKAGLELQWDTDLKSLIVQTRGLVSFIPEASVGSWQPSDPTELGIKLPTALAPKAATPAHMVPDVLAQQARAHAMSAKTTAQIENPTRPTNGLTGLEGAPKYKPHAPAPKKTRLETAPTPPKPDKDETH